jgi:hypothetical protein
VQVVVMNMAPGAHAGYDAAKAAFSGASQSKGAAYITFVDRPGPAYVDPTPGAAPVDDLHNPRSVPGAQARRQTMDVVTLLDYVSGVAAAGGEGTGGGGGGGDGQLLATKSELFMFLEDDFDTCGHAVRVLQYALQKLHRRAPSWLALRVSYGMNGVVLRTGRDTARLAAYLRSQVARLPVDLLWREWALAGGRSGGELPEDGGDSDGAAVGGDALRALGPRQLYVYRQNLFAHTGDVSSFAVRPERKAWPGCYAPMRAVWSLHRREQFDGQRCGEEDLSPCDAASLDDSTDADWATRLPLFGVADDGTPP